MQVISLTSIPPRFDGLAPVLTGLLAQGADAVLLCLPRVYTRFTFTGPVAAPSLPEGVQLLWTDTDFGPATKLLPALRAFPKARITCCDDDMAYAPGWLEALVAASAPGVATTGAGWSVARLNRRGAPPPATDIAQGFSGLSVTAEMFGPEVFDIPEAAWTVDDLWLSGHLARAGIPVQPVPEARARVTPLERPCPLQAARVGGRDRAGANAACAALLHRRYGIWPPL